MPVYHRVKVYTWNGLLALRDIDKIKSHIALAYTAALVEEPTPTKLHIRCVLTPTTKMPLLIKYRGTNHTTTTNEFGKYVPDPDVEHLTVAYKNQRMGGANTHAAYHAYHHEKPEYLFRKATFDIEKRDDTPRGRKKKGVCWPHDDEVKLIYLGEYTFKDGVLLDPEVL
jgi:hypothetical protein